MPFSAKFIVRLRRFLIGLACLATLIAVAWQIENVRGQRAWTKSIQAHAARGDLLDYVSSRPSIPDEKNFLRTPLLAGLLYTKTNSPEFRAFQSSNELYTFYRPTPSTSGSWSKGTSTDLDKLASEIREHSRKKHLPGITATSSAEIVLQYIPLADPALTELRDAALQRPRSMGPRALPAQPSLANLFEFPISNFQLSRHLGRLLSWQASAAIVAGDHDAAYANTLAGLQLARGIGDQTYTLVEEMIAIVLHQMALQPLWEGLQQHVWTDEQLARFSTVLSESAFLDWLAQTLRNERNAAAHSPLSSLPKKEFPFQQLIPEGWWKQNLVTHIELSDPVIAAITNYDKPEFAQSLKSLMEPPRPRNNPYTFVAYAIFPSFQKLTVNATRATNAARMAQTACALERHRLAHGAYPETLAVLVPAYLPSIPKDVINGAPLHYSRNADGTFLLYSFGPDGDDDSGSRITDDKAAIPDGDWAW